MPGTKTDGMIVTDMMQKLGFDQPTYDADQVLAEIADVVPFFKGVTRERLGKMDYNGLFKKMGLTHKFCMKKHLN